MAESAIPKRARLHVIPHIPSISRHWLVSTPYAVQRCEMLQQQQQKSIPMPEHVARNRTVAPDQTSRQISIQITHSSSTCQSFPRRFNETAPDDPARDLGQANEPQRESLQQRSKEGSRVRIVCRPHHNNIALRDTSFDYGIVLPTPHMVMPY